MLYSSIVLGGVFYIFFSFKTRNVSNKVWCHLHISCRIQKSSNRAFTWSCTSTWTVVSSRTHITSHIISGIRHSRFQCAVIAFWTFKCRFGESTAGTVMSSSTRNLINRAIGTIISSRAKNHRGIHCTTRAVITTTAVSCGVGVSKSFTILTPCTNKTCWGISLSTMWLVCSRRAFIFVRMSGIYWAVMSLGAWSTCIVCAVSIAVVTRRTGFTVSLTCFILVASGWASIWAGRSRWAVGAWRTYTTKTCLKRENAYDFTHLI